jgi:uncharacterized membrane protein
MSKPRFPWSGISLIAFVVFAAVGTAFSLASAHDFVAHLDRQVHSVTCSYIPGLSDSAGSLSSGCYTVMMSPYSSVLRQSTWGGVPIAIPSLGVFAFALFWGIGLIVRRRELGHGHLAFAVAAALLPAVVSVVYWVISVKVIGTVCKNCVGVYVASFGMLASAGVAFFLSRRGREDGAPAPLPWRWYGVSFVEGLLFVALPLMLFLALKPAYTEEMGRCGGLIHTDDKYGVRVKINDNPAGIDAVELVDPLCPACKAFHDRLEASGQLGRLDLEAVLFPLDDKCNWMVDEALHPGACTLSEAVLCAGGRAPEVLDWSLDNHVELRDLAGKDPAALVSRVKQRFPFVADCLGKPAVRSKVNRSLRWVISNSSKVMTPQLFVQGVKLCDEDSDLGLDYALGRMLETSTAPEAGVRP